MSPASSAVSISVISQGLNSLSDVTSSADLEQLQLLYAHIVSVPSANALGDLCSVEPHSACYSMDWLAVDDSRDALSHSQLSTGHPAGILSSATAHMEVQHNHTEPLIAEPDLSRSASTVAGSSLEAPEEADIKDSVGTAAASQAEPAHAALEPIMGADQARDQESTTPMHTEANGQQIIEPVGFKEQGLKVVAIEHRPATPMTEEEQTFHDQMGTTVSNERVAPDMSKAHTQSSTQDLTQDESPTVPYALLDDRYTQCPICKYASDTAENNTTPYDGLRLFVKSYDGRLYQHVKCLSSKLLICLRHDWKALGKSIAIQSLVGNFDCLTRDDQKKLFLSIKEKNNRFM